MKQSYSIKLIINMEAIDLKKLRRNIFGLPTEKNVCRSLFGEVDHEEVKRDLEREYKETLKQKSTLWNFDFHNYSPVDNSSGLKWIPEAAQVSEHAVTSGRSLVSSLHRDNLITGKRALQQKATSPLKATTSQQQPQKHDIRNKSITENKQTCLRDFAKNTTTSTDEEVNVIKIVTESPTRKITKENVSPVPVDSTVAKKIDITETSSTRNGKRKRSFQPTIDDFMKKKKPRMNASLNSSKTKSSSATLPIASRLRSSPAVKIQV